jgi:hypothetical protein
MIDHKEAQHRYWRFISADDFENCSIADIPVTEFTNSDDFCQSIHRKIEFWDRSQSIRRAWKEGHHTVQND